MMAAWLDLRSVSNDFTDGNIRAAKKSAIPSTTNNSTNVSSVTLTSGSASASITADGASYVFIRATVKDTAGAVVQGVTVTFAKTAGTLSSSLPPTITPATTAITDASGIAQLYLVAPFITGSADVTANTGGASSLVIKITFTPGAPAVIGLNAQPSTVSPGGTTTLTAVVLDANGNPVSTGQTVNFSTSSSTGGIFTPLSQTTDANGRASVAYAAGSITVIEVLTATATKLVQAWRKPAASARARSAADWARYAATTAELVDVVTRLEPPRKLAALAPLLLRARAVSDAARRLAQLARSLDSGLWPTVAAAAKIANAEEIVSDLVAEFDSAASVLAQLAARVPVLRCDAAHVVALKDALRLRGIAVAVEAEPNA